MVGVQSLLSLTLGVKTTMTPINHTTSQETDKTITEREGYAAMFAFLREMYLRTKDDSLASILGFLQYRADGNTVDPAMYLDWERAVRMVREGGIDLRLPF